MNRLPRSLRFTPNWAFRLLGLASAGLLAGFSPAVSGETITLPDPLFTNQFTSVEAWVQLDTVEAIVLTEEDYNDFAYEVWSTGQYILNNTFPDLYTAIYDSSNRVETYMSDYAVGTNQQGRPWNSFCNLIRRQFATLEAEVLRQDIFASQQIDIINSAVASLDTNNRTNVITTVTFGQEYGRPLPGGGCECPDYTVYLQGIHAYCLQLKNAFVAFSDAILSDLQRFLQDSSDLSDGLQTGFDSMYDVGRAFQRLMHQWHEGYIFPTNTPSRPLWVSPTGFVDVVIRNTNEIAVGIGPESMGTLTNAILAILLDIDAIRTNREAQARSELEEDVDEGESDLAEADSDRYNPDAVPSFEFWGVFRSLATEFQHMSDVFRSHGTGGDVAVSGANGWRLLSSTTFQFGGEDGETVTIPAQTIDITANGEASETASTIFEYCSRLFGLLWDALICLLDFAFIRWLVRLCGTFLGVLSGVLSGDLSGLGNIIPKLGEALTHPDN